MSIRRLFPLLSTIAILFVGCAGATPTAIISPTASNVPTVAPTVTAVANATNPPTTAAASSTQTPSAVQTQTALATVLATDIVPANELSDTKQARLRLGLFVLGGPHADLWVNGAVAVIGGIAQENFPPDYVNGYIYLPAGTYSIAVVPTGQGIPQALIGPLDLALVSGHRYTLAVIGQATDKRPKPLVIDETAAEQKAGAVPTDSTRFWIDNMLGVTQIVAKDSANKIEKSILYGEFGVGIFPAGTYPLFKDPIDNGSSSSDNWNEPGTSNMSGFNGSWPGVGGTDWDQVDAPPTSELNIIDFLQGFSGKHVVAEGEISFDTLLAALTKAGLTDMLKTGGPYYLLAPTDSAFADLPKQQLDALLADQQALARLLKNLIVPAYVVRGSLSKTPNGVIDRTLTNLLGTKLTVGDGYTINGTDVNAWDSYFVANGSQVKVIKKVLLPAAPWTHPPNAIVQRNHSGRRLPWRPAPIVANVSPARRIC